MTATVTIWDVEARMRQLLDHHDPFVAAYAARTELARLTNAGFIRPGDTMDGILDAFNDVVARAIEAGWADA